MIPNLIKQELKEKYGAKIPLLDGIDKRLPAKEAWQKAEHGLQRAFFGWLMQLPTLLESFKDARADLWLAHAIPNGGNRNVIEAGKLVAEGVKGGVPDVFFPVGRVCAANYKLYNGLYIEFKKSGGRPSEDQRCFLNMLTEKGYRCYVVNDLNTAKKLFIKYYHGRG